MFTPNAGVARAVARHWWVLLGVVAVFILATLSHSLSSQASPSAQNMTSSTPTAVIKFKSNVPVTYTNLETLRKAADVVVVGVIGDTLGHSSQSELVTTVYQLNIVSVVSDPKGLLSGETSLKLNQPGGMVGDKLYENADDPLFTKGARVILFLDSNVTTGLFSTVSGPYGRFNIQNGLVVPQVGKGVKVTAGITEAQFIAQIQANAPATTPAG